MRTFSGQSYTTRTKKTNYTLLFAPRLTDLYILVKQDSGEIRILDDDDNEITRCVVEEWIDNTSEHFYTDIQPLLKAAIHKLREPIEAMHILRPFSFVLVDEEHTNIAELYLVDDDTLIIDHHLMEGLAEDLDAFWNQLAAE